MASAATKAKAPKAQPVPKYSQEDIKAQVAAIQAEKKHFEWEPNTPDEVKQAIGATVRVMTHRDVEVLRHCTRNRDESKVLGVRMSNKIFRFGDLLQLLNCPDASTILGKKPLKNLKGSKDENGNVEALIFKDNSFLFQMECGDFLLENTGLARKMMDFVKDIMNGKVNPKGFKLPAKTIPRELQDEPLEGLVKQDVVFLDEVPTFNAVSPEEYEAKKLKQSGLTKEQYEDWKKEQQDNKSTEEKKE